MPWVCLVGGSKNDHIEDVLWFNNRVYFCGVTGSFDGEWKAFVGRLAENRIEYFFKVIREAGGAFNLCHYRNALAVCGLSFLGYFDLETGKVKWIKGTAKGLSSLCACNGKLFTGGAQGSIALLSDEKILAEKILWIRNKSGEWSPPYIWGTYYLDGSYIVAGHSFKLVSDGNDFFVGALNEELEPEWLVGIGGSKDDYSLGLCCDSDYIYVCGSTNSTGFGGEDIVVACLNKEGGLEWCRVYGTERQDVANSITVDNKYLYIASGTQWFKKEGYACILTLDRKTGDIVDGRLIGLSGEYFTFSCLRVVDNEFLLGGCTTLGFGNVTGLLMYLPKDYLGEISIDGNRIEVAEWVPKSIEWQPMKSNLEAKTGNRSIFVRKMFNVVEWTPKITLFLKVPELLEASRVKSTVRSTALTAPAVLTTSIKLDYLNLLSTEFNLVRRLDTCGGRVFSVELNLPSFSGVWRCVKLGCGGWGCAYLAEQNGRKVVFKVPRGYESIIEENMCPTVSIKLMKRIISEAKAIKQLNHPNILKLLDYSSKYPLLVYGYADYGSLEYQLKMGWNPTLKEVVLLGIQIGDALRYIHGRGLVHCDIKPSNIFFANKIAKLGDFSALVKLLSKTSSYSHFAYTPGFAAPEQRYADLRRKTVELGYENRIDVYQLGNLLLYLLTGETIDGEDVFDQKLVKDILSQVEYSELRKLISVTLAENAWERPSSDEVVKYLIKIYRSL